MGTGGRWKRFFKGWDAINLVMGLILVVATLATVGCAPVVKMPVGTFAITSYESPSTTPIQTPINENPSPAISPESSSGNALQPKDGAGLGLFRYAVRVKVEESPGPDGQIITNYGSGVLVSGGVLTAAHVVKTQSKTIPSIQCEANGQVAYGRTQRINPESDLAYVVVSWQSPQVSATVARRAATDGDPVDSIGRGNNGSIDQVHHTVTASRQWDRHTEVEVSPTFNQGRSGGGLFNSAGELCGIVSMAVVHPERKGLATGLDAVQRLLSEGSSNVVSTGDGEAGDNGIYGGYYLAWIVTRGNCVPCRNFHGLNGNGSNRLRLRYLQIDGTKPGDVPDSVWRSACEGGRTRGVPFAMWQAALSIDGQPPGHFTSTACGGMSTDGLLKTVAFSGLPETGAQN